jgi:quercetin dioxygenase-like cupin family protein
MTPRFLTAEGAWQTQDPALRVQGKTLTVELRHWTTDETGETTGPEEIGAVLAGRFELICGDESHQLGAGQGILIPSNAPHRWRALEDGTLYRVFGPPSV